MPDEPITALNLTGPELAWIAARKTNAEFQVLQRDWLTAWIERTAQAEAAQSAQAVMTAAVQEAQAAFPTMYEVYP